MPGPEQDVGGPPSKSEAYWRPGMFCHAGPQAPPWARGRSRSPDRPAGARPARAASGLPTQPDSDVCERPGERWTQLLGSSGEVSPGCILPGPASTSAGDDSRRQVRRDHPEKLPWCARASQYPGSARRPGSRLRQMTSNSTISRHALRPLEAGERASSAAPGCRRSWMRRSAAAVAITSQRGFRAGLFGRGTDRQRRGTPREPQVSSALAVDQPRRPPSSSSTMMRRARSGRRGPGASRLLLGCR